MTNASIRNPHFPATGKPLCVQLAWDASTLPVLVQWKMPCEGIYALGLEPANCHVEGSAAEKKARVAGLAGAWSNNGISIGNFDS